MDLVGSSGEPESLVHCHVDDLQQRTGGGTLAPQTTHQNIGTGQIPRETEAKFLRNTSAESTFPEWTVRRFDQCQNILPPACGPWHDLARVTSAHTL